jgi:hypothetical protein
MKNLKNNNKYLEDENQKLKEQNTSLKMKINELEKIESGSREENQLLVEVSLFILR